MSLRVELFIWSCWINAAFSFAMVALVLLSRPLTRVKIYWTALCIAVGLWSISLAVMSSTKDYNLAYLGTLAVTGTSLWIPTFIYHTVRALLNKTKKTTLVAVYLITLVLSILDFTGHLNDVRPIADFYYYTVHKPLYHFFPLFIYTIFIVVGVDLWRASRKAPPIVKKQFLSLLVGIELAFLGGQTTFFMVYGIEIFPWGNFFVPVYVLAVGYSMLKHQFLDFKLVIKKFSLIIGIYACLAAFVGPLTFPLLRDVLSHSPDIRLPLFTLTILYTLTLASGPIIYAFIIQKSFWLKKHMTMGLTHELKSPLANIKGALDALAEDLKHLPQITPKSADYMDVIERNAIRLEVFVNDLLNIASIQEDSVSIERRDFSLTKVIDSVCEIYQPLIESKGIKLNLSHEDKDIIINGDESKIRQVVSNLLSNALKFSAEGVIEIRMARNQEGVLVSVSDQGPGINPENREKIFDRFFQENRSTRGAGLGLAITKAWVEAHSGKIWAESEGEGKGTTIKFTLSATETQAGKPTNL